SQTETPGNIPKGVTDENGNPVNTTKKTHVNYYIFAVHPPSYNIIFTKIWLKGKFYTVKNHKVDSTPVIKLNKNMPGNPVKEVLVPYTEQKVISIVPDTIINKAVKRCSRISKLSKKNELIITYTLKNKKHFIGVEKIKVLEPVANL
ncbi:MAG: hypothetical protein JJE22_10480, partial [Bacteroidia bacterium]|nr:hypothetical protein [Bacteroidia bacterium]